MCGTTHSRSSLHTDPKEGSYLTFKERPKNEVSWKSPKPSGQRRIKPYKESDFEDQNNKFKIWARDTKYKKSEYMGMMDPSAPKSIYKSREFLRKSTFDSTHQTYLSKSTPYPTDRKSQANQVQFISIIQENDDLDDNGDYAPAIFKAMTKNITAYLSESDGPLDDSSVLEAVIECDFDPLQKRDDLYKGKTLVRVELDVSERMFESDSARSIVFDMASLYVSRTKHARHGVIFEEGGVEELSEFGEEGYVDGEFPPEKSSIIGLGLDEKGDPVDHSA